MDRALTIFAHDNLMKRYSNLQNNSVIQFTKVLKFWNVIQKDLSSRTYRTFKKLYKQLRLFMKLYKQLRLQI